MRLGRTNLNTTAGKICLHPDSPTPPKGMLFTVDHMRHAVWDMGDDIQPSCWKVSLKTIPPLVVFLRTKWRFI